MAKNPKDASGKGQEELYAWLKQRLRFGSSDDTVILFIPSHDRDNKRLNNQDKWASEALELMGELYGGATGFKELVGTWRDDDRGGKLIDDEPIMIQSLAKRVDVENESKLRQLGEFCSRMGKQMKQGAIGIVLNDAIHFMTKY